MFFSNIKDILELQKIELEKIIDKLDGIDDFATRRDVFKIMLDRIKEALNTNTLDKLYSYMEIIQDIPRMPSTKVVDEELKKEVTSIKKKITDEIKKISSTLLYKDTKGIVEELNSTFKYAVWYKQAILDVEQRYTEEKLKLGSIDFADYEILTLQALKNDSVREKYKEKYTDIYIDEYQDTSDIQEAILMQIAKENNVIMVGDVKQSIYGFRNAAPELFSSKYERLQRVEDIKYEDIQEAKIVLAQNFRSRKEVIDSTNEVFSKLMNLEFGGAKYGDEERLVLGAAYPLEDEDKKTELHIIEKESIEQTNSEKASGDIQIMAKKLTKVALIYDFDETLSVTYMQDYILIPSLGMKPKDFWKEANQWSKDNCADQITGSMYYFTKVAKEKGIKLTRQYFCDAAKSITYFDGVEDWFDRINSYGHDLGLQIEHYIISSGYEEIIAGASIRHHFKDVFGCSYAFGENGTPIWPARIVNYSTKTQYLSKINKGLGKLEDRAVNEFMPDEERPIPYRRMIYFGDGMTDIPSMKITKAKGGTAIAVYQPKSKHKKNAIKLLSDNRVNFALPADYSDGKQIDMVVKTILDKLAKERDLECLQAKEEKKKIIKNPLRRK